MKQRLAVIGNGMKFNAIQRGQTCAKLCIRAGMR